jgi:sarcosine oxidase subunit alpha
MRPWYYDASGRDVNEAYVAEMRNVREAAGLTDISTLGKIDVQGPDAGVLLDQVYANGFKTLAAGRARYGVMLRDDGIVLDDGTTSRVAEHHYFMTTTTAEAGKVMAHLEFLLQTAWPDLRAHVTSVTDQWAAMAVSGPSSRELLAAVGTNVDISNQGLPFMGVREGQIGEIPVRLHRVSFSGELAYEIYTPAGYGESLWDRLVSVGQPFGLVLYGVEALGALRIEKGHVAGSEIDGRTTLDDLGLGRMASKKKPFVGAVLRQRQALVDADRPRLVGFVPVDSSKRLRSGTIIQPLNGPHSGHGLGYVSATTYSPQLGHDIALGFVAGGAKREGELFDACYPLENEVVAVRVTSPHFIDPQGERLHA